jgi:predicted DNA-binding transcriptional regulator YafY
MFDAAQNLLDSITSPLAGQRKWYEKRVVVPFPPSSPVPLELWDVITGGLRENRHITFDYKGAWDEESRRRRVRPYQLLFDNGLWYLYGFSEERQAVRMFSLTRMQNASVASEKFALPKDYDYNDKAAGSYFGVFAGRSNQHFRIAFYEESAIWVQERKWAADMAIEELEEGKQGVIVSFTSTQYEKVLEWALSQGCNARPLEPADLVEAWQDNARKMAEMARTTVC